MLRRSRTFFTLPICALVLLVSCGGEDALEAVTGSGKVASPVIKMPSQVLGLRVAPEDVSKLVSKTERPYVDSVGVFSLREKDLLRASFQASRFNRLADPGSSSFRASVIALLGSTKPHEIKVEDTVVYSTAGNQQNVFVWFEERGLFVLSVHQDYEFPRTLLRRLINLRIDL